MASSIRRLKKTPSLRSSDMQPLTELETLYLTHHEALGHSINTVNHYRNTFKLFHRFLDTTDHPRDMSVLTTLVMQQFIAWMRVTPSKTYRGKNQRTIDGIHGIMKDMRAFTRFLVAEDILDKQPKVPVPKLPHHLFPVLTETELETVLKCSQLDSRTEIGTRNRALVAFMLDTGVRLSEVANLPLSALNLKEQSARVIGKGNKERMVYYSEGCADTLKRWLAIRGMEDGSVFWLKPAGVRQVMERIKRETGLTMLFAHQLRHTAFTLLVKGDMDLHSIKRMAGHASVTTTEQYLALAEEDIRTKQNAASPFDRISDRIEPEKRGRRRLKSA